MDFGDSPAEADFRHRLRAWLAENNPGLPTSSTDDRYWAGLIAIFRELVAQAEATDVRIANHAIWRCMPGVIREEALRQGLAAW